MNPPSTVDNSLKWRAWHGSNYFVGGITFLFGSILLFPDLSNIKFMNAGDVSGWLYTIGSTGFLIADITEWLHYVYADCRYSVYVINFLMSVMGSLFYLIGSACFVPQINEATLGFNLFIIGSALIVCAQVWKIVRSLGQ